MQEVFSRFNKAHMAMEAMFLFYLLLSLLNADSENTLAGFIIMMLFITCDFIISKLHKSINKKLFIVIRYIQIVIISVMFVISQTTYTAIMYIIFISLLIIEIIFMVDYADAYTRTLTIGLSILPIVIMVIVEQLFFSDYVKSSAIEMICVIVCLTLYIGNVSALFVNWVTSYEKRVFEQRRMADNAKEMNIALKEHQEKIKKTNEELGIQKIKLEAANKQVNRVNSETKIQNEILQYISSSLEINSLMSMITKSVMNSMTLDVCIIIIKENVVQNQKILYNIEAIYPEDFIKQLGNDILNGCFNSSMKAGKMFCENHPQNTCFEMVKDSLASIIFVPIKREGETVGALICGDSKQDFFDESKGLFNNLSTQLLMAMDNANLYAEVQQLAIRDSLTGLYNRRHLNEIFDLYSRDAIKDNKPITAALLDIDNFKSLNDKYGHLFGDLVLVTISKYLLKKVAELDGIAARYGGEEFVLAFYGKGLNECIDSIEKIRKGIRELELEYEGVFVQVKVSIGVTSFPEVSETPEQVLNRADLAMYYSKEHGKDRTTVDSEEVNEFFRNRNSDYQFKGKK